MAFQTLCRLRAFLVQTDLAADFFSTSAVLPRTTPEIVAYLFIISFYLTEWLSMTRRAEEREKTAQNDWGMYVFYVFFSLGV